MRTFDGELDPFVFSRLDAGHFVLFRRVWLDGQRLIQGAVIAQKELIAGLIERRFSRPRCRRSSDLTIAYRGDLIGAAGVSRTGGYPVSQTRGDLLYRAPLSAPLNDIELIFSVADLPVGPGGRIVGWATSFWRSCCSAGWSSCIALPRRRSISRANNRTSSRP